MIAIWLLLRAPVPEPVTFERRNGAAIVRVQLNAVRIKVGLAQDRVGPTESLASLAKRKGALAAINGSFFDAYTSNPIKSPNHTVITNGQVVHLGNVGSIIGFKPDGKGVIGRLNLSIAGFREGSDRWPYKWYAYWVNRNPTANTVTIFTPEWGSATGLPDGRQIVIDRGKVVRDTAGSQSIPSDGWVLYINGVTDSSFDQIKVGSKLYYRFFNKLLPEGSWGELNGVTEGIGAGPTLVKNGQVSLMPSGEGFSSPKILTGGGLRSAVGLTSTGDLLMVAASGTIAELAQLMKSLGCLDAMNLDGGASSGLIFKGKTVRTPGRQISNALLVLPR